MLSENTLIYKDMGLWSMLRSNKGYKAKNFFYNLEGKSSQRGI